jgi:hypothetical protein
MIKRDMDFIKERNAAVEAEGRGRKVDYVPVVLPGGSVSLLLNSPKYTNASPERVII